MASNRDALLTAAVLTVLLIFPTASQDINYGDTTDTSSPVISTETITDVEVDIDHEDPSTVTVERHDTLYSVEETPQRRLEKIETPEAELKIKRTNNTRISVIKSPYGTLKKGIRNGKTYSKFEGANRSKLLAIMNEMKSEASNYRQMARDKMLPDIEIRITKSKANDEDERLVIDNDDTRSVELSGWQILNSDGDTYTFEDIEIPARATMEVYTASEDELNVSESEENIYVYGTGTDWDYNSDTATLFNLQGEEVDQDSY